MEFSDIWQVNFKKTSNAPTCSFCGSSELIDEDGVTGLCNRCGLVDCPDCDNKGGCPSCKTGVQTCDRCGGHGRLPLTHPEAQIIVDRGNGEEYSGTNPIECTQCEGTGKMECGDCEGEATCFTCQRPTLISAPYIEGEIAGETLDVPEQRSLEDGR